MLTLAALALHGVLATGFSFAIGMLPHEWRHHMPLSISPAGGRFAEEQGSGRTGPHDRFLPKAFADG